MNVFSSINEPWNDPPYKISLWNTKWSLYLKIQCHGNYDRKFLTNILPHSKLLLCVILEMSTIGTNTLVSPPPHLGGGHILLLLFLTTFIRQWHTKTKSLFWFHQMAMEFHKVGTPKTNTWPKPETMFMFHRFEPLKP
jgi:hypothetical protein